MTEDRKQSTIDTLVEICNNNVTAMQAAYIEWQHGKGAEAAMKWIVGTLRGPGLIPDEGDPYGKEAQAWYDANCSDPLPQCFCGRPSNQGTMERAFCSEAHYKEWREQQKNPAETQNGGQE